jgi:DHA2 family multidrug resistance protein
MPSVRGILDLSTDAGRAMADRLVGVQAQIIAFAHDYMLVMVFILCTIPLALMIGSTKAALRSQAAGPEHAVIE